MSGTANKKPSFSSSKLLALDSNIFIYEFEANQKYIPYTNKIFNQIVNNKLQAVTSVISVIEALSYPSPPAVVAAIMQSFETMENLMIIDVNQEIGYEAARLRRDYKFLTPDSIQLATALVFKADRFITNDPRLKTFKEVKVILLSEFN